MFLLLFLFCFFSQFNCRASNAFCLDLNQPNGEFTDPFKNLDFKRDVENYKLNFNFSNDQKEMLKGFSSNELKQSFSGMDGYMLSFSEMDGYMFSFSEMDGYMFSPELDGWMLQFLRS